MCQGGLQKLFLTGLDTKDFNGGGGGGGARILNGMAQLIPKYILKHQQEHFIEADCYKLVIYLPANS